jgi:hypothetical protein
MSGTREDSVGTLEPWWVNHAEHMKGFEAFGVSGREPTVRRLGLVTFKRGEATTEERPGTELWGPGEVRRGVAGVYFSTHGDDPDGAYIYVIGTSRQAVEDRWRVADGVFQRIRESLWPEHREPAEVSS